MPSKPLSEADHHKTMGGVSGTLPFSQKGVRDSDIFIDCLADVGRLDQCQGLHNRD